MWSSLSSVDLLTGSFYYGNMFSSWSAIVIPLAMIIAVGVITWLMDQSVKLLVEFGKPAKADLAKSADEAIPNLAVLDGVGSTSLWKARYGLEKAGFVPVGEERYQDYVRISHKGVVERKRLTWWQKPSGSGFKVGPVKK